MLVTVRHQVTPPAMAVRTESENGRERQPLRTMKTEMTKTIYFMVTVRSFGG